MRRKFVQPREQVSRKGEERKSVGFMFTALYYKKLKVKGG